MFNIVHLSINDYGGAGLSIKRLHLGLIESGINSTMLCLQLENEYKLEDRIFQIGKDITTARPILKNFKTLEIFNQEFQKTGAIERFANCVGLYDLSNVEEIQKADIIHLGWVDGFVDIESLPTKKTSLCSTLHDMSLFTGGCHYAMDCIKYIKDCGRCPQLNSRQENDLSKQIWQRKNKIFKKKKLHLIAPSKWICEAAKASAIFKTSTITTIPHGIDTKVFARKESKHLLGIKPESKVVLIGTEYNSQRKGLNYVLQIFKLLRNQISNIVVVSLGRVPKEILDQIPFSVISAGYVNDTEAIVNLYNCADVFLNPSLGESFGLMTAEAMSCSIPVVAFDSPGTNEIITSGLNGILVRKQDINETSKQLELLLTDEDYRKRIADLARKTIVENFSLEAEVQNHIQFYNKLFFDKS